MPQLDAIDNVADVPPFLDDLIGIVLNANDMNYPAPPPPPKPRNPWLKKENKKVVIRTSSSDGMLCIPVAPLIALMN